MSPICTACGEPILATEKTASGPNGIVHYRCHKRVESQYEICPGCSLLAMSPLLACCLSCSWKGDADA